MSTVAAKLNKLPKERLNMKGLSKPLANFTEFLLSPSRTIWVISDFVLVFWLFMICIWLSPHENWGSWKQQNTACAVIFASAFLVFALGMAYYERAKRFTRMNILVVGFCATILSLLVSLAAMYFGYYEVFGRFTILYGSIGAYIGITGFKLVLGWFLRQNPYRFTIIGTSPCCEEIKRYCANKGKDLRYYSFVPKFDNTTAELPKISDLSETNIPNIVLANSTFDRSEYLELALEALKLGYKVTDEITFYTEFFEQVPIGEVSKSWVLREGLNSQRIVYMSIKRLVDIVIAFCAIIVGLPIFLLIAAAIKLSSRGPVVFVQRRLGQYSQGFNMYKFRTMKQEASEKDGFTRVGDDRVTWVGKIIRPLHFDELPQLLNILLGKMSIVGPRPETFEFAQKMSAEIPLYELRYILRPGLTGHAQIHQGYAMDCVEDTKVKLGYDLFYVCNCNLLVDLRIILRTAFSLIKRAR